MNSNLIKYTKMMYSIWYINNGEYLIRGIFMTNINAVIFDLDDTIINTSEIKKLRKKPWNDCYSHIPTKTYAIFDESLHDFLKDMNQKVGIVTNSPRPYAERVLKHHNFKYHNLVAYHDVKKRKPHPEPFYKCADLLGVETKNIISVGDHTNDIIASKEAGMKTIGVTWGECSLSELKQIGCDFIVNDAKEAMELLKRLKWGR